jgi:HK97 family phage major capsid protein
MSYSEKDGAVRLVKAELDKLKDTILDRYDSKFDEVIDTLADLQRPDVKFVAGGDKKRLTPESKAFDSWYRTGTLTPDEKKTLTIGSDPSFGFACPSQLETSILHALTEGNPLRGISRVYQTSNTSLDILKKSASGAVVLQSSEVGEILATTGLAYAKISATPATEVYLLQAGLSAKPSALTKRRPRLRSSSETAATGP